VSNVNPEEAQPKEVGVETPADTSLILTPREREQFYKFTANPMEVAPEWKSYWEQFVRDMISSEATNISQVLAAVFPTGSYRIVPEDLTAQTSLYVYSDATGDWLYCNGASISGAGYTALETLLGSTTLPDVRGRPAWFTGTHADADLFDNDGVAVASRTPTQTDSDTVAAHTHSLNNHTHSFSATTSGPSSTDPLTFGSEEAANETHTHTVSGTTGAAAGNTGSGGSDTLNISITVPHVFIGSLLIRP
jgi:microcystin-dependent protein